jgi:hypothetical protein
MLRSLFHHLASGVRIASAAFACVLALASGACIAGDSIDVLDKARALEAEGMSNLTAHYRFEEGLLSEDNDRILVFLSMPHGARVILDEIAVHLDGKPVHRHAFGVNELLLLQGRATQLLYAGRIARGDHAIRFEVKTMQGKVLPMNQPFGFSKGRTAKYFEVQLSGAPARQIDVQEW